MNEQLLGLAEIAELYGVEKSTANNWSRQRDFPEPRWKLKMGPIWTLGQLEHWRIPARTVIGDSVPPAPVIDAGPDGVTVRCPLCPKKHYHGGLGPKVPHCSIPTFSANYEVTDPDGILAKYLAKSNPKEGL
jgi:hypothetical protein